jgi:hypothetical protein
MTITNTHRAAIMKAAWTIIRKDGRTLADALRRAWVWMKRKLGLLPAAKPRTSQGAGWARPVAVFTSSGNRTVWNIGRSYARSGHMHWIGR